MPTVVDINHLESSTGNEANHKVKNKHKKSNDHSPTSSTNSNGPKTPHNESNENNFYDMVEGVNGMKLQQNLVEDSLSAKSVESVSKLMLESDANSTNFAIPYSRKPQRTSMETTIKLKVRYVARDLWQTVTFQNTLTVAQVRDICLIKCGLMQATDLSISQENSYPSTDPNDTAMVIKATNSAETNTTVSSKDKSWRSEYALFWNAAGHWLDDFRRLNSYNLRALDVLELQVRNEFIFIQPSMYFEHYAEGYLYKLRNGINPSWRSRWFVLQGRNIWYFKKRKDPNPAGSADLSRPFQVQETSATPNQSNGTESCLMLRFNEKCWWLKAFTPDDLDHWRRIFITLHREVNDNCAANYSAQPVTQTSSKLTSNLQTESDDGSFNLNTSENGSINSNDDDGPGVMRIKAGFMFRRQPITHGFKERYFVLRGKELSCYKSDRFDKSNNPAKVISLHTVDVVAYINVDKYFFQIKDKQAADTNFLQQGKAKKAGTDFKSIISSTKSLPMKVNTWISQTNGSQLNTEYLYVEEREDWDNWRIALESIANLEIEIKDVKDLNKKELKSSSKTVNTSNTTSSFFSFNKFSKSNRTKPSSKEVELTHTNSTKNSGRTKSNASNRFSAFIKNRPTENQPLTNRNNSNPKNNLNSNPHLDIDIQPNRYEDIDELTELTPLELSLGPTLIQQHEFITPNLLLKSTASNHPTNSSNLDNSTLTPLDKLLLEDSRERERMQQLRTSPGNMLFHQGHTMASSSIDARSSCSAPSENIGQDLPGGIKGKTSTKFLWFKRK